MALLKSAAALADAQMAAGRRGTSRRANVHDTNTHDDGLFSAGDDEDTAELPGFSHHDERA